MPLGAPLLSQQRGVADEDGKSILELLKAELDAVLR